MATTVVQVAVLGAGDDGPRRDPAASLSLEVGEKSSTVIRRSHLAYTVSERPPYLSGGLCLTIRYFYSVFYSILLFFYVISVNAKFTINK